MSKHQWKDWEFEKENLTLNHKPTGYYVDLETCTDSAEVLDWIFQVLGKNWGDAETLLGLLNAFRDLLDPQRNLCSVGRDLKIDPKKVIAGRRK